jgi:hypothetical protein
MRRSRVRASGERLVMTLTPLRYFRCHECNDRRLLWPPASERARTAQVAVFFAKALALIAVIAAAVVFVVR